MITGWQNEIHSYLFWSLTVQCFKVMNAKGQTINTFITIVKQTQKHYVSRPDLLCVEFLSGVTSLIFNCTLHRARPDARPLNPSLTSASILLLISSAGFPQTLFLLRHDCFARCWAVIACCQHTLEKLQQHKINILLSLRKPRVAAELELSWCQQEPAGAEKTGKRLIQERKWCSWEITPNLAGNL